MYSTATKVAFAVGLPIGLAVILWLGPTDVYRGLGDSLLETILYSRPIVPLIAAYVVGLWLASEKIPEHLRNGFNLVTTSFFFSLQVNGVFWATVVVVMLKPRRWWENLHEFMAQPMLWFNCSVALATFTIGYLICWITNKKMFSDSQKPRGYYDFE
ncbi:hypothetical protein OI18_22350 [Flavihumibacter solisilvae]|uniref:Uncharacterized protein n=2 Tax=Flavihumibacter solisilvae TaxID=1349421 RepID=A0A0C1L6Q4_9BACT|nr:hypothetical protein OI18_22350 [Flavihumibacter solisilvae]